MLGLCGPLLVLSLLGVQGCKDKDEGSPSGALSDASFDAPPDRHVVAEIPDGFFTARDTAEVPPVTTGSPGVGGGDGSVSSVDVRASDAGIAGDGPREVAGETANGGCDLLQPQCSAAQGCYPTGDGRATCRLAGGFPENADCNQHDECLPQYLCASGFTGAGLMCLRICDPRTGTGCPGNRACRPYAGTAVGTCAP